MGSFFLTPQSDGGANPYLGRVRLHLRGGPPADGADLKTMLSRKMLAKIKMFDSSIRPSGLLERLVGASVFISGFFRWCPIYPDTDARYSRK